METIIAGSRGITDIQVVQRAVVLSNFEISEVVSGGARGVDALGEQWAAKHGVPVRRFPADWSQGPSAGPRRNQEMADYAKALIAVWDGKSRGTRDMIRRAESAGLQVYVHRPEHTCHANGCNGSAHPELPFCKRCFNLLPEPHRKKLWKGRRLDGQCGACDMRLNDEVRLRRSKDWNELLHLALAILLQLDFDGCGAPPPYQDEQGFCWACGIDGALKNEERAKKIIKRFGLKAA